MEEHDILAEFANHMSNILCGYGEASLDEMITRAEDLIIMENKVKLLKHKKKIMEAIDHLESVISDAKDEDVTPCTEIDVE